jgi:hypothetical protein
LPALLLAAGPSLHIGRVFEYTENKMLNKNIDPQLFNEYQENKLATFFQKINHDIEKDHVTYRVAQCYTLQK